MNLKKIAASIAALGAVTFAHAANVEFYGSIDNSVSYIKAKGQNGQASVRIQRQLPQTRPHRQGRHRQRSFRPLQA